MRLHLNMPAVAGILTSLLASACVTSPQPLTDRQNVSELLSGKHWQQQTVIADKQSLSDDLLALFNDPALNEIVVKAINNNVDLKLTAERFQEIRFSNAASRSNLYPKADIGLNANRNKSDSGNDNTRKTETSYRSNLNISWEIDLWGKLHQQHLAERHNQTATWQEYIAAKNSIAAQTMKLWFDLVSHQKLIELQQERLSGLSQLITVTEQRFTDGLATLTDLNIARSNHGLAKTALLSRQQDATKRQFQLQLLLGEYPKQSQLSTINLPQQLPILPIGIPAHTIHHRPDIKAAWLRVNAAHANQKSSYLAFYPSIELTAESGKNSTSLSKLFDQPSIWNILGMIKVPLFQASQLKNTYLASRSNTEQHYIEFLQAILNAFHEVENSLSLENSLFQQEKILKDSLRFTQASAAQAEKDYRIGQINILDYLQIQLDAFDLRSQFIETLNQRLQNRIDLGLALGKGV